ncbi:hypothetical protein CTAYLR_005463 [Chrysophaeum taylorii]|uniref:ADF-H domain-containing protein n=1 Tax=Chrysophaeum taylorii TaxID=2483200 RepID=A0AAD7UJQ0_9STRA|nr:hypothetical protein CTAYLR_005463 [Chrysophaeum taylorii]
MIPTTVSDELKQAWLKLLDDTTEVFWLTAHYENKSHLVLKETGIGGRTECLASVADATEVIFGGFRVTAVDEGGATTQHISPDGGEASGYRVKHVMFQYNAPGAPVMSKARASSDRGLVQEALPSSHCQFQIEELKDLSEDEIIRKLSSVGARPSYYDFDNHFARGRLALSAAEASGHDINHVTPRGKKPSDEEPALLPDDAEPPSAVDEAAPATEAPAEEAPTEAAPAEASPTEAAPAEAAPAEAAPAEEAPAATEKAPAEEAPAAEAARTEEAIPGPPVDASPATVSTAAVAKVKKASPESHAILLFTSVPASTVIEGHQTFIRQTFNGRKIPFKELDGMDMSKKEERNKLFGISGLRGAYPQVFVNLDGEITFIGDFDQINELNDCDELPKDILDANPGIPTLSKTFAMFLVDE